MSEVNLTPSTTEAKSSADRTAGVASGVQIEASLSPWAVVNDQVTGDVMALPAASVAPPIVTVYRVDVLSAASGVSSRVLPDDGLPETGCHEADTATG